MKRILLKVLGIYLIIFSLVIIISLTFVGDYLFNLLILPILIGGIYIVKSTSKNTRTEVIIKEEPALESNPEPEPLESKLEPITDKPELEPVEPEPEHTPEPVVVVEPVKYIPPKKYEFRVAGTTYEDRDKILKHFAEDILYGMDPADKYDGYKNKELEEYFYYSGDNLIYEIPYDEAELYYDIELIEEPDNPYDPNAIKVNIDGLVIGYVPKKSINRVKQIIQVDYEISAYLIGGKYKYLDDEDKVRIGTNNYGVNIELMY